MPHGWKNDLILLLLILAVTIGAIFYFAPTV